MVSFLLFVLSIFIFSGYFMLYWFIRKDIISIWGALVMVSISLPCYLLFPYMIKTVNVEIQSVTIILFLFVLTGIGVVSIIENKISQNGKIKFKLDFDIITSAISKINLFKVFKILTRKINIKALNALNIKNQQSTFNVNQGICKLQINNEEEKILNDLNTEQTLNYVDFEHKSQKGEDVFSKYIRGEISISQVVGKIQERAQKEDPNLVEENDRLKTIQSYNKRLDLIAATVEENSNQNRENNTNNKPNELVEDQKGYKEILVDNENNINAKSELKIEECIGKAFELKSEGLLLEAVEYYIEALDKKPEEQLILWIVIEICSIYKQMKSLRRRR